MVLCSSLMALGEMVYTAHLRGAGLDGLKMEALAKLCFPPTLETQDDRITEITRTIWLNPPQWFGEGWLNFESYHVDCFYSSQLDIEKLKTAFREYCAEVQASGFCLAPPRNSNKDHAVEFWFVIRVIYRKQCELEQNLNVSAPQSLNQAIRDIKEALTKDELRRVTNPSCRLREVSHCATLQRALDIAAGKKLAIRVSITALLIFTFKVLSSAPFPSFLPLTTLVVTAPMIAYLIKLEAQKVTK